MDKSSQATELSDVLNSLTDSVRWQNFSEGSHELLRSLEHDIREDIVVALRGSMWKDTETIMRKFVDGLYARATAKVREQHPDGEYSIYITAVYAQAVQMTGDAFEQCLHAHVSERLEAKHDHEHQN